MVKKRKPQIAKFRAAIEQSTLQKIVRLLNGGFVEENLDDAHAKLIQIVQAWQQAQGADWDPFEREVGAPKPTLLRMKFPLGCPDWNEIQRRCRGIFAPSGTGAYPAVVYAGKAPWTAWDYALNQFVVLMFNPIRDKLAGPCARCGKYYIKKRASQKVYCSRICGNAATAVARTRKKWDEEHREKLELAKRAMTKWSQAITKEPFQQWAQRHYKGLTTRFLTRAINNKELPEPRKRR